MRPRLSVSFAFAFPFFFFFFLKESVGSFGQLNFLYMG